MKLLLTILIALGLVGCTTPQNKPMNGDKQTFRQSVGRPMKNTGQSVAKVGTGIVMAAGINIVLFPIIVVSIPFYVIGVPLFYAGNAIAGDNNLDPDPFSL